MLRTKRLLLQPWASKHKSEFVDLMSDRQAMRDYGKPLPKQICEKKFETYLAAQERHGYIRWRVSKHSGEFLGYTGILHSSNQDQPLGAHDDIGWRFFAEHWGNGYATEAARAALVDGFERCGLKRVFAYTAKDNIASQAVMNRLGLTRQPDLDFSFVDEFVGHWHGMVWVASPESLALYSDM